MHEFHEAQICVSNCGLQERPLTHLARVITLQALGLSTGKPGKAGVFLTIEEGYQRNLGTFFLDVIY